jgi:hypothetical protein
MHNNLNKADIIILVICPTVNCTIDRVGMAGAVGIIIKFISSYDTKNAPQANTSSTVLVQYNILQNIHVYNE